MSVSSMFSGSAMGRAATTYASEVFTASAQSAAKKVGENTLVRQLGSLPESRMGQAFSNGYKQFGQMKRQKKVGALSDKVRQDIQSQLPATQEAYAKSGLSYALPSPYVRNHADALAIVHKVRPPNP